MYISDTKIQINRNEKNYFQINFKEPSYITNRESSQILAFPFRELIIFIYILDQKMKNPNNVFCVQIPFKHCLNGI